MGIERRKYIRFLLLDNTLAILEGMIVIAGKVNDISRKGLFFSYLSESIKASSGSVSSRVDIFHKKMSSILPMCHVRSYMTFQNIYPAEIIVS
jgi:hypothetical protein